MRAYRLRKKMVVVYGLRGRCIKDERERREERLGQRK